MFSTSGIFDKADIQQLSLLEGKIATQVIITLFKKPCCVISIPLATSVCPNQDLGEFRCTQAIPTAILCRSPIDFIEAIRVKPIS